MADELRRVEALFQAAADLPEPERDGFLERECSDAETRRKVETMLAQYQRGETLATPTSFWDDRPPGLEGPGTRIGRYKLLERIGEGGFGVVYMAEQQEPVLRKVALKIIKLGMDTREVVARFEAERQALAMMDHPNIARVLDGGATDTGRPYFVMELVRGISITEYCDVNNLSMRERLELFVVVCQAVQHAHQKGVIHRDLKPSNVMVTLHDGAPVPKVIDFGVAKAMHTRLTEKTLFTAYDRFIGTPAYMSPEQAEMSGLDIDTRADIYSLGVLLYELLTGTTPFAADTMLRGGLAEIQRVLREEQPPRPSLRIHTSQNNRAASRRRLDVQELSRRVKGELDWIVMKALEKDRVRRYATANELAADLRRHLDGEPVLAGQPSRRYRLGKALARHRTAVGSASLVALALIAGMIGTASGMFEAARQRDTARQEADRARVVTDFLVETLALTDPVVALDPDLSVRTLLDRAAAAISGGLAGQPGAEARVRATIGRAYENLGELELAEAHLRRSVELFGLATDADNGELYTTLWRLTHVLFKLERPDAYETANHARRVAHDHMRSFHPELATTMDQFLLAIRQATHDPDGGFVEQANSLLADVDRQADVLLKPGDPLWPIVADLFMDAGYSFWYTPLEPANELYFARALAIQQRELPPSHTDTTEAMSQLVGVLNRAGRPEQAEARIRGSIDMLREVYPPGSFQLAFADSMLGQTLVGQGRYAEAEPVLLRSHEVILSHIEDERTFYVLDSYYRLARLYNAWGRDDRARPYRDTLIRLGNEALYTMPWPMARETFGPRHDSLLELLDTMEAECRAKAHSASAGDLDSEKVNEVAPRVVAYRRANFRDDEPEATILARLLLSWSNALAAGSSKQALVEDALQVLERYPDRNAFELSQALAHLADLADTAGDRPRAAQLAREAEQRLPGNLRDDWVTSNAKTRVGRSLLRQGLFGSAESLLLASHSVLLAQMGPKHPDTLETRSVLVDLYNAWKKPGEAARFSTATP